MQQAKIHRVPAALFALAICVSSAWAQAQGDTLQKIKETGTLTLGYRESSVPFSFLDAQQKPVGFSLDLCAAIADQILSLIHI